MSKPEQTMLTLAAELVAARTESQAAAVTARAAAVLVDAAAARVWLIDRTRGYRFAGCWPEDDDQPTEPDSEVARAVAFGSPAVADGGNKQRSRLIMPLQAGLRPMGAVELLESRRKSGPFQEQDAAMLRGVVLAADRALESIKRQDVRERGQIAAITRLAHLFDLGRTVASTLDPDDLARVVVNRVVAAFEFENAYLWLPQGDDDELTVVAAAGQVPEAVIEWKLEAGSGAASVAQETQDAHLFDDADEIPDFEARPDVEAGLEIFSAVVAPIITEEDEFLGVIEAINRQDGEPLGSADVGLLREIASTTAIALSNARRIDAERRATDLGALLETAQALSTHLDAKKVTFALVHQAASVLNYRRAAVALTHGGGFELAAVSGQTFVDDQLPELKALSDVLRWASRLDEGIYVVKEDDGNIDADRPETQEKFRGYFELTGNRTFLTVPLEDEQGRIGMLAMEAAEPYAFSSRDLEAASLLATQATTAIRNAILYESIPMVRVFKGRQGAGRVPDRTRRLAWAGGLALAIAALALVPMPLRVGTGARVLPAHHYEVTAEVDGRVAEVLVHEGQRVRQGDVLSVLDDREYLQARGDAEARYQVALREHSRALAGNNAAEVAIFGARLKGLEAELALWDQRLELTRVRSPVDGIVATPRIEELAGTSLARGDVFCEVVDPENQYIETVVAEADAGLVRVGQAVKVKLNAHPTRSFRGEVERIGVLAVLEDGQRVFLARVRLAPADVVLRSGMTGRAKINTGLASVGRVIFRRPGRWLWGVFWGWLP